MNALPLSASTASLPSTPAGGAAVLPPALLPVQVTGLATPAAAQPRFDRALQLLLDGAAAAAVLPLADADEMAADPASTPQAVPGSPDDGTDAQAPADAGSLVLQFDPALASLQPPPAALALAQAGQQAWTGAAAVAMPAATAAPVGLPAAPVAVAQAMAATAPASAELVVETDPSLAPQALASTPAQPAAARAAAQATALTMPADTAAPLQERGAGATTLPSVTTGTAHANLPGGADGTDPTAAARGTEAGQQGRAPSLLQVLSDRIAVQTERGAERVVIRLDPPYRGQIEIHIRQDATGATQVQLNASHADVVRQLHAIGDSLRQELAQRQGGDVSVQIAQQSREHDGRQQRQDRQGEPQQQPGRALDEQTASADTARFALATDRP